MKTLCLALLIVAGAAGLVAQDNTAASGRIAVPLSSPTQPATIKLRMINGSVTVNAGGANEVVVESSRGLGRGRSRNSEPPPGMHRIEMGGEAAVAEDHNVVTIRPAMGSGNEHITITAPANSSLEIKTVSCGSLDVRGITGDIDVECINGSVRLENVSGSVIAHTINGSITATIDKAAPDKPMSFTSFNGKLDVTFPADTKARLRLKTVNGSAYTDFDVKLEQEPNKPSTSDGGAKGKYKIAMNRSVYGSINGGGPEYLFQTVNGEILIHKK